MVQAIGCPSTLLTRRFREVLSWQPLLPRSKDANLGRRRCFRAASAKPFQVTPTPRTQIRTTTHHCFRNGDQSRQTKEPLEGSLLPRSPILLPRSFHRSCIPNSVQMCPVLELWTQYPTLADKSYIFALVWSFAIYLSGIQDFSETHKTSLRLTILLSDTKHFSETTILP